MNKSKRLLVPLICLALFAGLFTACDTNAYIIDSPQENRSEDRGGNQEDSAPGVDPFEGLVVEFDGVSPYCTISFNNAGCSQQVQERVSYSLEPDSMVTDGSFEIGDTVTVYALQQNAGYGDSSDSDGSEMLVLSRTSRDYTVENVPRYLTELTADMDLTQLKSEISDMVSAITAFQTGGILNEWSIGNSFVHLPKNSYKSSTAPVMQECYFSVLKMNTYGKFKNDTDNFNRLNINYSIEITNQEGETFLRYFTVIVKNLVLDTDGTIGWGKENPALLDMEYAIEANNMESLVNNQVTSLKGDYNVTLVNEFFR